MGKTKVTQTSKVRLYRFAILSRDVYKSMHSAIK